MTTTGSMTEAPGGSTSALTTMTAVGHHGIGQIATTVDGTHGGIAMTGTIAMIGAGASVYAAFGLL